MSVAGTYCRDVSRQLRYLASWPPGSPAEVGSVGSFYGDKVFDVETKLGSFKISFGVEDSSNASQGALSYTSDGVSEFGIGVGGMLPTLDGGLVKAEAKVTISFTAEHAIVFQASGLTYHTMLDQPHMARQVARLIQAGEWNRDWHVVTQVVGANSASVLISNTSSAQVELALGAAVTVGGAELLSARFSPKVISQKQMSTVFVDEGGLTPLFRAKRVKRTIFGNAKLKAGFGPAEVSSILDLDDDALEQALFDEVDMVDKVVLGDA